MQLHLDYPEIPKPYDQLWEHLDEETRRTVIAQLAKLIMQAAPIHPETGSKSND
ncbi:MAG: hypothetical protein OXF88_16630 [Rhodobacteraceae bacterium]|nr:hypothetical protein [Paracoccaceae bacterium]